MSKTSLKRELLASTLRAYSLRVFAAVLVMLTLVVSSTVIPSVGRLLGDSPTRVSAATAGTINFQARLQNAAGNIAPDGSYNVEFKLYNVSSGGSALWTEDYLNSATQGVTVKNGYLTVNLGSITTLPTTINYDQDLWLTMTVRGTGSCAFAACTPADAEMSPRLKLTASAYAFKAGQLAQFNSGTGFTSTLQLLQPTGGNQTFQVADQGAAGTYNLLTQNQANTNYIQNQSASAQTSSNFWVSGTGKADTFNATTALQTGGTTRIDASGNLTNIGNISGTGNLQLSGTTGSNYIMSSLGLGTTNPQAGSALTIANGQWLSAIDSSGTGYINMFQVNSNNEIQVGAALNVDGSIVLPTNGGQMTFSDLPIDSSVTAGTAESYTLRVGSSNALTIYGEADGSGNAQNVRVAIGTSIAPAYTLDVGGDINSTGVYRINGTQICASTGCTPASGSANYIQNGTSVQTSSNFNISGAGVVGGNLTAAGLRASTVDIATAGTLAIGGAIATQVNIAQPGVTTVIRGDATQQGVLTLGGALTTTASARLSVQGTMTSSFTGAQYGINNQMNFNPTGASVGNIYGTVATPIISGSSLNTAALYGMYSDVETTSGYTGTVTSAAAIVAGSPSFGGNKVATNSGLQVNDMNSNGGNTSGTLNNYGVRVLTNTAGAGAGGTVNNYGAYISVPGGSGGTTNNYGVYIQGNGAGTLSYALYSASTAASSLAGSLDVSGYISTTTGYKFNGTAGSTTTCSGGNVLSNMVIQGGIVTGGTCAANGGGVAPTLQDAYNNSSTTNPQIQLSTGNGGLKIRDASTTVGNIFQVQNSGGTSTYFAVTVNGLQAASLDTTAAGTLTLGGTNATAITLADNVTVSAGQYISLVGGITSTRPASPTEGMIYFDSTTKQLLTYANGKWQADRESNTKIVAASNSSQAAKDAADYVADGDNVAGNGTIDGDQVQINAALTAAAGGKVYLLEGTYVADATILIPNNTTLMGAGFGTTIEIADIDATDNLIENSDTSSTGTGIAVRDLKLDGRSDLNTAGNQSGLYLLNMGGGSGATARNGATISNVSSVRFRYLGIALDSSAYNSVSGVTVKSDTYGMMITGNNNTVTNSIFQANSNAGIEMLVASNNTITNNIFQGNAGNEGGILITSSSAGNAITGNTFNANAYGIYLSSNANTISSNTFRANTGFSIRAESASNNTISGNNISTTTNAGIRLASSSNNNNVTSNTLSDNGGATANDSIVLSSSDSNSIIGNNITDTSATTTNNAIDVSNSTSDTNYLADNTLGGGSINEAGTGTIYAGQQNSSGYFGFKASTSRVGIGNISPAYALDVTGDINSTTGFRFNGTAGATTTCSGGNVLSNMVVQGGIVTGGSCVANGGGSTGTLQNAYDNSGATPVINLGATGGGIKIQDAASTVGGNLFSVSNSTGSTQYLAVTTSGIAVGGNITATGTYNGNTFTSSTLTFSAAGTATISSAASQGLNITGNGASTISTTAGALAMQGNISGLTISTANSTTSATGDLTITSGNVSTFLNTAAGTVSIDTGTSTGTGVGTLNLGLNNAKLIQMGINNAATINIGSGAATGTISIGRSTQSNTLNLGTANPAANQTQTINIGNGQQTTATSAIAVNILSGTAGSNGTATLKLANNDRVTQVDIGNVVADAARSFNLFTGNATAVDTINIGTGATTVAGGKTIHIGDGTPTGTGTNLITIGSTANASSTIIQAGSAGISLSGATSVTGTLSGSSTINAVSGFLFNGTAGSTTTCSGGQVLSNIVVQGGIVTGGSCAVNGGGIAPTLQDTYNNSTSPATILLANAKDFLVTAADTATDPNILFNLQCVTSCGSNGRFAVQNAGTDVFAVNPNGTIVVGSGGNTITLSSAGMVLAGTARNAQTIRLTAEYPGAVLDNGTLSNNTGTMVSRIDLTNRMNYYKWTTTQGTNQSYDVDVQVPIPKDFGAWASNPLSVSAYTSDLTNGTILLEARDSANSVICNFVSVTPGSTSAWATNSTACTLSTGTYTAGDYLTLRIRLQSPNAGDVRVGNIALNYLSNK
jgi:parallel beta-helix repeat protein